MSASETETRGKAKRQLEEMARDLAAEGRWAEAIEVNQQFIERSPKDVNAFNRLGKAYFELHRYRSAYEAYSTAATLDPANVIAQRNLSRIEPLKAADEDGDIEPLHYVIRPGIFIEEVGKTYVDDLVHVAGQEVLTELSSGIQLTLTVEGDDVSVVDQAGRYIGQVEPRLAKRLIELLEIGNRYEVYVTSNSGQSVRVIIREAYKHPDMGNRLSFPRQGKVAIPRAYLRDTRLFRDEPDMLLGDDEDEDLSDEEAEDYEASDGDEDESEYVEESGGPADEDEESAI
ncbi:MAG TPA: tetratricopeptide repeat protein [Thermomicrobiales bacterium]|nr:tetratricopeptide repeat protein [Thermomicrobiales bacterium]